MRMTMTRRQRQAQWRHGRIGCYAVPKLLSTSFVITDIGRGGRQEGNSRQLPHILCENRILCKKTFQRYPFCKNLTDVTLVWEDGKHLKKHTKCSYHKPFQSQGSDYIQPTDVSWTRTFHLWAPQKSAQASDRILYKKVTYSVETFKKSNDFADVPLVCDDDSAILAPKVTLF